ncbi:MAG: GPP34 family phosphoprotein [Gammaproteobacteria bacterium]|nr:GPP34 family phosphoprotein [Gammaproteobacteria bacterium]
MTQNLAPTLAEDVVLLLLDDQSGTLLPIQEAAFKCALAGAMLMDLAFAYRIDTDLHSLMVSDRTPVGDPMLDRVLERISGHPEVSSAHAWVEILSSEEAGIIREQALARLVEHGVLQRHRKFPRLFRAHRYARVDGVTERELKGHIRDVLHSDDIPDPRDVALICLVDACSILADIFPREEIEQVAPRIEQFHRMDLIGHEVTGTIDEARRAIVLAVRTRAARFGKWLAAFSFGGGLAAVATLLAPRIPMPDRFGPGLFELLWSDETWQQWSGYTLLGISLAGLLVALLMKTPLLVRRKSRDWWPLVHVGFGAGCVLALFAHTGFRFGVNLNAALMWNYLALLVFGALVGISMRRTARPPLNAALNRLRRFSIRAHLLALLPLPALLALHLLIVYLY